MKRSLRFKWAIGSGIFLALVAVAVVAVVVVGGATSSCSCAIPPSDEGAIETAQTYVADVSEDPETLLAEDAEAPTAEQVEQLQVLDDPETIWTVHLTERPEGGYGRSPGVRLVVGIAPDGAVGALVVYTETDTSLGTVDPAVATRDVEPQIARSGEYPIFGQLNVGMSDAVRGHLTLVSLTEGRLALSPTGSGGAWAYIGADPLTEERYRYVRGGHNSSDGVWWFSATWFSPSDPVTEED